MTQEQFKDHRPAPALLGELETLALLKRMASRGGAMPANGERMAIDLALLRDALASYVTPANAEVRHVLQRDLKLRLPESILHAPDLDELRGAPAPEGHFEVSEDVVRVLAAAARRGAGGFLRWRSAGVPPSSRAAWFDLLQRAMHTAVPGQEQAALELARNLALQLSDPQRRGATHALLSGPTGAGTRQMARSVAEALKNSGYRVLELELSSIRCEEEARVLDGGDPGWSGMRPGQVTQAVFQHPRTVVVMHDVDQTFPSVHRTLLPALRDGVMEDQFGLREPSEEQRRDRAARQRTSVSMRDAIFLFTSRAGHDLWAHPDVAELLAQPDGDLRDVRQSVIDAMRCGERAHRGETLTQFDPAMLAEMERHLVLLRPQGWACLQSRARQALQDACQHTGERLGLHLSLESSTAPLLAQAWLLSQGGQLDLELFTATQAEATLLTPLIDAHLGAELAGPQPDARPHGTVRLALPEREQLQALLASLGPEPAHQLLRRRQTLRFDVNVTPPDLHAGTPWQVQVTRLRLVQTRSLADFRGEAALTAAVPDVSFADVAGHDEAKAYLNEVADLYAQADQLLARGLALPRGAVIHGPPGTGKTLLAQAFASTAGLAFIATGGVDLLNPERAKALFDTARRNAPSLVFIDEADTLGRRGEGSAVHDAAINRLLVAIQGFDQRAPVFVLAATNRPHLLDPALTRPGRLDRALYIGPLDRTGRLPLVRALMARLQPSQRADDALLQNLLSLTHGLTGAALAQIRRDLDLGALRSPPGADMKAQDLLEAINAQKYGQRVGAARQHQQRMAAAIHEAGHAVLQAVRRPDEPIEQVSTTPRSLGEGFVALDGERAQGSALTADDTRHRLAVLLAGRVAEQLHHGAGYADGGSRSDLARARALAFTAVAHHGMDAEFGPLSLAGLDDEDRALLPDTLRELLWARVRAWLLAAERDARKLLQAHWPAVQALAAELLQADFVPGARVAELVQQHGEP